MPKDRMPSERGGVGRKRREQFSPLVGKEGGGCVTFAGHDCNEPWQRQKTRSHRFLFVQDSFRSTSSTAPVAPSPPSLLHLILLFMSAPYQVDFLHVHDLDGSHEGNIAILLAERSPPSLTFESWVGRICEPFGLIESFTGPYTSL